MRIKNIFTYAVIAAGALSGAHARHRHHSHAHHSSAMATFTPEATPTSAFAPTSTSSSTPVTPPQNAEGHAGQTFDSTKIWAPIVAVGGACAAAAAALRYWYVQRRKNGGEIEEGVTDVETGNEIIDRREANASGYSFEETIGTIRTLGKREGNKIKNMFPGSRSTTSSSSSRSSIDTVYFYESRKKSFSSQHAQMDPESKIALSLREWKFVENAFNKGKETEEKRENRKKERAEQQERYQKGRWSIGDHSIRPDLHDDMRVSASIRALEEYAKKLEHVESRASGADAWETPSPQFKKDFCDRLPLTCQILSVDAGNVELQLPSSVPDNGERLRMPVELAVPDGGSIGEGIIKKQMLDGGTIKIDETFKIGIKPVYSKNKVQYRESAQGASQGDDGFMDFASDTTFKKKFQKHLGNFGGGSGKVTSVDAEWVTISDVQNDKNEKYTKADGKGELEFRLPTIQVLNSVKPKTIRSLQESLAGQERLRFPNADLNRFDLGKGKGKSR